MTVPHLFGFGFGYTARVLARRLAAEGWIVGGTCRTADKAAANSALSEQEVASQNLLHACQNAASE